MYIEPAHVTDAAAIVGLLQHSGLPQDGLLDHLDAALVARHEQHVVGCAALEVYGAVALLRSVAVAPAWRRQGVGQQHPHAACNLARHHGVTDMYLLTETADRFFARVGFQHIDRDTVHPGIHQSVEWTAACPASALAMHKTPG